MYPDIYCEQNLIRHARVIKYFKYYRFDFYSSVVRWNENYDQCKVLSYYDFAFQLAQVKQIQCRPFAISQRIWRRFRQCTNLLQLLKGEMDHIIQGFSKDD